MRFGESTGEDAYGLDRVKGLAGIGSVMVSVGRAAFAEY